MTTDDPRPDLSVPADEMAAIRGVAEATGYLPPRGAVVVPELPAAESPAPVPAGAATAATDAAGGVTDEAVTAALLADVEWARAGRELVWQTLSAERARNLIGAAVRAERERIAALVDDLASASGGPSHFAYRNAAYLIREGDGHGR